MNAFTVKFPENLKSLIPVAVDELESNGYELHHVNYCRNPGCEYLLEWWVSPLHHLFLPFEVHGPFRRTLHYLERQHIHLCCDRSLDYLKELEKRSGDEAWASKMFGLQR